MLEISLNNIDWLAIRQALSLALLKGIDIRVAGGNCFLESNAEYKPLFVDMKRVTGELGVGELNRETDSIIYYPAPIRYGTFNIKAGKYSSLVELVLFLLPSLFYQEFRSVLNLSGVSHSSISYPSSFVKETLFYILEKTGHYASMALKRFGFHGSGGGKIETRVYPAEPEKNDKIFIPDDRRISGAKIFLSGLKLDIAEKEKKIICRELNLPEKNIGILNVIDSNGYGNSVQVFTNSGDLTVVFSREMNMYNDSGNFTLDEEKCINDLSELIAEINIFIKGNDFPDYILREAFPYLCLSGSNIPDKYNSFLTESTYEICRLFLD